MLFLLRFANFAILALLIVLMVLAVIWVLRQRASTDTEKEKSKRMTLDDIPADAGLRELIAEGRTEEAIEVYRRFTGVDTFSARDAVRQIEREVRLGLSRDEVIRLVKKGEKARAIERYQEATGANLEEALAAVEQMEADYASG